MLHPAQDRLLRYAKGTSTEDEAEKIIDHLDGCRTCEERVVALKAIQSDFEGAWSSFLDEAAFRATLPKVAVQPARIQATMRGWITRANQLATAAMDRLTAGGNAVGLQAAFVPVYSGVASPEASAAAIQEAEAAAEACARGDAAAMLEHLERAKARDPEVTASAGIDLKLGDRVAGRIVVDANRGSVSVLVYEDVLENAGGSVIFEQGGSRRKLSLTPATGATYLLAEIEDLADGPFQIQIEVR